MTTSAGLRGLFVDVLKGATDAGQAVYSPFDWPTAPNSYPTIFVRAPRERKVSLGPNVPQFEVFASIEITARTKSAAMVGDAGSALALAAAERLKGQIEDALINNPAIWMDPAGGQRIEQFSSVDSDLRTSSEGEMPMAELAMTIEVKFYQGPEDFYPVVAVPLESVGVNFDAANVFDPTGTYPDPPFPDAVNPAPRTSGPDGRNEGELQITLPQ